MSIECRAWAGNIQYHGGSLNRAGSVTFEIQVDTEGQSQQNLESFTSSTPKTSSVQVNRTASI